MSDIEVIAIYILGFFIAFIWISLYVSNDPSFAYDDESEKIGMAFAGAVFWPVFFLFGGFYLILRTLYRLVVRS